MKKQELALLVIVRGSNTNRNGLAKTFIRVTLNGHSTECYLGYIVPKDHWDNDLKLCLETYPDSTSVNDHIDDEIKALKAHYLVLSKNSDNVTPEMVKMSYNGTQSVQLSDQEVEKKQDTLLGIADGFIAEFTEMVEAGVRSEETLKQWNATREKIIEFARFHFKRKDIPIKDIDRGFAKQLYRYLTVYREKFLKIQPDKRKKIQNLGEVSARKQIKNIKQLIGIAVDDGQIDKNPIGKFKTSGGEKEVPPLEMFEIQAMLNKHFQVQRLEEVRDVYIFQCFTGFAYTDLNMMTPQHITRVGLKGEPWLIKERGKTNVSEMVPLLPIALKIIDKYRNHPYCVANNKLLPVNSNTHYNAYLKEIAVICGINRVLKTHLARHTFADIMLNICNVPLEDVSKMLGHKSIRTTMRYCRVRKARISQNMKVAHSMLFDSHGNLKPVA